MKLSYWTRRLPLKQPYHLSFATLHAFDTAFLRMDGEGRVGFGEVTPLPGYSSETIETVRSALDHTLSSLCSAVPFQSVVEDISARAPMVASALVCARETWEVGVENAFAEPVEGNIPVAALCAGDTVDAVAQSARQLTAAGFDTLKMKIGCIHFIKQLALLHLIAHFDKTGADRSFKRCCKNVNFGRCDLTRRCDLITG